MILDIIMIAIGTTSGIKGTSETGVTSIIEGMSAMMTPTSNLRLNMILWLAVEAETLGRLGYEKC